MSLIVSKKNLTENVVCMEVLEPKIAKKAKPGQFIIFKVGETGERVPLTIADTNIKNGTVTIVFQTVGVSTMKLAALNTGDFITDFIGPLGNPSELPDVKKVAVIGGGLGCAIAYPQAKALHEAGVNVELIAGFRSKDFVFWEEELKKVCSILTICTDDGSYGMKGFVTNALEDRMKVGDKFDAVIAIGPVPMMKNVCILTKKYNIKTIISMNTIMIDGTGMCGGCRLTVDGKVKFACVDGPDFDGHSVDFNEVMRRNNNYRDLESKARDEHCRLLKL
ncbi:MAG: oxidoreductase FAD/NAD(P)-binding domain protein [Clostridia bacterium]|nr:oxidoreductase FAD/NAD(P)-binding domain protein [Clostridia bacterium]